MKLTKRTTQPLPWEKAIALIEQLQKDGSYQDALFVTLAIFTGYRISDMLKITIEELSSDEIGLTESKTEKTRKVIIGEYAAHTIDTCLDNLIFKPSQVYPFVSSRGTKAGQPIGKDTANDWCKRIFAKYAIEAENDSCHTFRKTFARRQVDILWEKLGDFNLALFIVGKDLNHASVYQTMEYTGYLLEYGMYAYENMQNLKY